MIILNVSSLRRKNIYSPGGKSYETIVFLRNTRGCIFEMTEEKGKRIVQEGQELGEPSARLLL